MGETEEGKKYYTHPSFGGASTWDVPWYLPPLWEYRVDTNSGRMWYAGPNGESSWERPIGATPAPPSGLPPPQPLPGANRVGSPAAAASSATSERAERVGKLRAGATLGVEEVEAERMVADRIAAVSCCYCRLL